MLLTVIIILVLGLYIHRRIDIRVVHMYAWEWCRIYEGEGRLWKKRGDTKYEWETEMQGVYGCGGQSRGAWPTWQDGGVRYFLVLYSVLQMTSFGEWQHQLVDDNHHWWRWRWPLLCPHRLFCFPFSPPFFFCSSFYLFPLIQHSAVKTSIISQKQEDWRFIFNFTFNFLHINK